MIRIDPVVIPAAPIPEMPRPIIKRIDEGAVAVIIDPAFNRQA